MSISTMCLRHMFFEVMLVVVDEALEFVLFVQSSLDYCRTYTCSLLGGGKGSMHIDNCWATAVHICPVSILIWTYEMVHMRLTCLLPFFIPKADVVPQQQYACLFLPFYHHLSHCNCRAVHLIYFTRPGELEYLNIDKVSNRQGGRCQQYLQKRNSQPVMSHMRVDQQFSATVKTNVQSEVDAFFLNKSLYLFLFFFNYFGNHACQLAVGKELFSNICMLAANITLGIILRFAVIGFGKRVEKCWLILYSGFLFSLFLI